MDESVYAALEWDRVVRAVRSRCVGPTQSHEDLPIARDAQATRVALEETAEAIQFLEQGDPVPVEGIKDIALSLSRVARDGALSGIELRDVGLTLAAARVLRKFLGRNRAHVPHLTAACPIDPTLDDLEDHIAHVIERDGKVSDHATPELRALRTEVANVRARLVGRLEELLRQHAVALQDSYYTVREGRYVLPMRADAHDRIQGIVHGTSASGATVFIEPRAIISYGNRLKIAEGEMEREEQRILLAVTDRVRGSLPTVLAAFDALNHADLRAASAKFARDFGARVVRLEDGARMRLVRVRHPVLAIDGGSVVPNDVEVASGHALVISGPNAGGKTVALKTVGLAALMVRAGLPLMAEDGSVAAFLDPVMADVGDAQSIAKNLSTFSAHVRNVARMLAASGPRALVLLDELAGGTDPSEGAALACALVDAFTAKGAAVIVTTHYEALKARGLAAPTLRNASVGFDVATLAPTFELLLDVPGSSSALVVAERFGIPTGVIAAARDFVPEQVRSLESLVTDVRERMRSVAEEREALALERAKVEREHGALREEREKYRARDQKGLSEGAAELAAEMERTKKELAEARRALRDAPPSDDT
ncbi:MAG: endonuclease MutS2, partial [Myxococcales bacterium]|nr:endonuclease MutS2 [Myxococcales bacterium]